MAHPIWSTASGSLGLVPENEYFQVQLVATDPQGGAVSFKALAGTLPPGIHVSKTGLLQGVPVLTDVTNLNRYYEFSVRAQDHNGLVADRTFNLTISNIVPPQIVPRVTNLGDVFDGTYYSLQLRAVEVNPEATMTWSIVDGSLPNGLTLSSSGLLSGLILPLPTTDSGGLTGFSNAPYAEYGYNNAPTYQNNSYIFTVRVFDGINYDSLTYKLFVVTKSYWTADTDKDTVDSTLTIDQDNRYLPIMITPSQSLPTVRSSSKFAFKFDAIDPNSNQIHYALSTGTGSGFDQDGTTGFDTTAFDQSAQALPPGLSLDAASGWLLGTVGSQLEAVQTYDFKVYAFETGDPTYQSAPVQYSLTVLGDVNNTITWVTSGNLGVIDNGAVSQFSVSAISNAGKNLTYSLVSDLSNVPQGLKLLPTGLIVGRTTFEYFTLDGGATTIDGANGTFDNLYKFTVKATSTDNTVNSTKEFTIRINNFNKEPYENLYLKALPTLDQRKTFLDIVNNTEIFPESLIYRSSDPNFGRARDIRSLFLAGLSASDINTYANAMATNTYNKRIEFSDVKTARAVDANFNTKYEVVYIELKDDVVYKGRSPANATYNPYISANVYPNSFANMSSVVANTTGYANRGALPEWMTSPQDNKKTLGFTRAIVLAYTVPDASKLIAYRLRANGITFNSIDFVADRYDLDNVLSKNYNTTTNKFILGKETTFDRIKRIGSITYAADYGVRGLAFDMVNGQTVDSIAARGGLDGVTYFNSGETLVFLQQENFVGETNPNDGWNLNGNVVPGFNEYINSMGILDGTSGFPANPTQGQTATVNNILYVFTNYDDNGILLGTGVWRVANQRSAIWTINISNTNTVTLTL